MKIAAAKDRTFAFVLLTQTETMKLVIFSLSTLSLCAYLSPASALPSKSVSLRPRAVRSADVGATTTGAPGNDTDDGPDSMFEVNVRILGRRPYKGKCCLKKRQCFPRPQQCFSI